MRRIGGMMVLALCVASCVTPEQNRLRDYNEDGVHLFRQGDYFSAHESFQAALRLAPEDADLHYNLGECYDRLGNVAKAEASYQACLQRSPNHPACRQSLASLFVRSQRWPDALKMTQDWLAREPKLSGPYAVDGWLWHQAGDLPRSQARLQQALEIDPNDKLALIELALVYEAMQRPDRALVLYERSLAQDPVQPNVTKRVVALKASGTKAPRPD